MASYILYGLDWMMLRRSTHTHTCLKKVGSNLHHVFKAVETMKRTSMGAGPQISS
jgi:hypothetical protein